MSDQVRQFTVDKDDDGIRLDRVVGRDGELADFLGIGDGHPATRIAIRPT